MNDNLTPTETEYMEYLSVPRTTKELMAHFSSKENAVWQIMRTLRLKKLAHHTQRLVWHSFPLSEFYTNGFWKITEDGDDVPQIPVTPLQTQYIKYLRAPHSTKEMMTEFGQNESAVQQVTRTLRLMEYVEAVGTGSSKGHGGCWKMWKTTKAGTELLEITSE